MLNPVEMIGALLLAVAVILFLLLVPHIAVQALPVFLTSFILARLLLIMSR